jgi:hypothetical protein
MQNVLWANGDQLNKPPSWNELEKQGMSEKDIRQSRLDICNACPHLLPTGHCEHCYCSISSITARPNAKCPIRLW